jgi:hypothetical protein
MTVRLDRAGPGNSLVRTFAKVVGPLLVLTGAAGLLLGETSLAGLLNIDVVEDAVHLISGGLLAYVGFGPTSGSGVRAVVGGLGVVYLAVGVLGFFTPMLFGLLPHGYSLVDNLIHLGLGAVSVGLAFLGKQERATATG